MYYIRGVPGDNAELYNIEIEPLASSSLVTVILNCTLSDVDHVTIKSPCMLQIPTTNHKHSAH